MPLQIPSGIRGKLPLLAFTWCHFERVSVKLASDEIKRGDLECDPKCACDVREARDSRPQQSSPPDTCSRSTSSFSRPNTTMAMELQKNFGWVAATTVSGKQGRQGRDGLMSGGNGQ